MSSQNVSKHAAICNVNGDATFLLNRGFRSVTRPVGQPVGVYELRADSNAGGNWAPTECEVQLSSQAAGDDPDPIATPPRLPDYRWKQAVDGEWYLQIRMINPDGPGLLDGAFSVKIERIN